MSGAKTPPYGFAPTGVPLRGRRPVCPPFRAAEGHRRVGALAPGLRVFGRVIRGRSFSGKHPLQRRPPVPDKEQATRPFGPASREQRLQRGVLKAQAFAATNARYCGRRLRRCLSCTRCPNLYLKLPIHYAGTSANQVTRLTSCRSISGKGSTGGGGWSPRSSTSAMTDATRSLVPSCSSRVRRIIRWVRVS